MSNRDTQRKKLNFFHEKIKKIAKIITFYANILFLDSPSQGK